MATTKGIDRASTLIDLGLAAVIGWRLDLALACFGASLGLLPPDEFPDLEREALYKESCVLAKMGRYDEAIERVSRPRLWPGAWGGDGMLLSESPMVGLLRETAATPRRLTFLVREWPARILRLSGRSTGNG